VIEGIRKAPRRLRKAGKTASLGKGSHQPFQRVVGRLIQSVQMANERMGFVQVSVRQQAGGIAACHPWPQPHHNAPVNAHGIALRLLAYKTDPLPPYPTLCDRGTPRNFSPTFPGVQESMTINQKEYLRWLMK